MLYDNVRLAVSLAVISMIENGVVWEADSGCTTTSRRSVVAGDHGYIEISAVSCR